MAQIKDILQIESTRATEETCRQIHLFQEGSFYRAYEYSAWLIVSYINALKPTRRNVKGQDDSIVFVGFPTTSLDKYVPKGCEKTIVADKCICITLSATLYNAESKAQSAEDFQNWKNSVPLIESKKDEHKESYIKIGHAPLRITEIMHQILAYPIEQKSPMESMAFLAKVKQDLANVL